jgi:hypothetical protein
MLDTNVYITERLEIINDGLNNAVDINLLYVKVRKNFKTLLKKR